MVRPTDCCQYSHRSYRASSAPATASGTLFLSVLSSATRTSPTRVSKRRRLAINDSHDWDMGTALPTRMVQLAVVAIVRGVALQVAGVSH